VNAIDGVATFTNMALNASPGTYKLLFDVTGTTYSSVISTQSADVRVANGAPASLSVSFQVSAVSASRSVSGNVAVIKILDAYGNVVQSGAGSNSNIVM
jgi:hypothetical protein